MSGPRPVVVVGPVAAGPPPYRPVSLPGPAAVSAGSLADLEHQLRRAGLRVDLDDPEQVRWEGGGPEVWRPHVVEVSPFDPLSGHRQVRIARTDGTAFWEPVASQREFEEHLRRYRPDVDPADPAQVYWADRPRTWSGH
jgi:hypothetical protein